MASRVSLAVPVFNGARFLPDALDAILAQTCPDFEVIVSDNASTDATPDICRAYAARDTRIRYHRLATNIGAGPNFNHAFGLARAPFFKWCAHDDLVSPNFLEACLRVLESREDVALAFGTTQCIDASGATLAWDEAGFMAPLEQDSPAERFGRAIRSAGTCFPVFGLFRAEALARSTLHRPYYGSDRALIAETALIGKVAQADEAVFFNREHGQRSINIEDHAERLRWHSASGPRRRSLEHINLLVHLAEIAARHGPAAQRAAALRRVAQLALTPKQMGRYALDLVRFVSPSGGAWLRRVWAASVTPESRQRLRSR